MKVAGYFLRTYMLYVGTDSLGSNNAVLGYRLQHMKAALGALYGFTLIYAIIHLPDSSTDSTSTCQEMKAKLHTWLLLVAKSQKQKPWFQADQKLSSDFWITFLDSSELRNLDSLYRERVVKKAQSIMSDPGHPVHELFVMLPSSRRLRSLTPGSKRVHDSFYPTAVRTIKCYFFGRSSMI